jgi:hypothetical protein
MGGSTSTGGAFTWSYPLWFGMNQGDHLFGGTVEPGSRGFVGLFTTEARAKRFIAADPEPDPLEAFAASLDDADDLHEFLMDLKPGWKYVVFNPVGEVVGTGRAVEIVHVLDRLTPDLSSPE